MVYYVFNLAYPRLYQILGFLQIQVVKDTAAESAFQKSVNFKMFEKSTISNVHVHYSMKRASVFNSVNINFFFCLMKDKTMNLIYNCIIFYFIYDVSC